MRAERLLSILMFLQVHRRVTARDMAERLEVSERTIYRDMEALSATGVPIYAERGAGGGWFLPEPYRTNLTGLSRAEIQALFLGTPSSILQDLGLQGTSEGAFAKLLAALPPPVRGDAEYARQRLYVDTAGWNRPEEGVPHLQTIQEAIWQERKLRLSYERADGTAVERVADPLGLVAKGSVWYLVAAVDGDTRTFRVSRVRAVEMLDQGCLRPTGFDLPRTWEESKERFAAGLPRYPVTMRADPDVLPRLRYGGRYSRVERVEAPDKAGWLPVQIMFETPDEACEFALSFGPSVEVVQPEELREQVMQRAEALVARYRSKEARNVEDGPGT